MYPECQLFITAHCHLCEQAEAEVMPWVERGLWVELIDIVDHPQFCASYQMRIPVLRRVDTGGELDWPFEIEQLGAFLAYDPSRP